MKFLEIILPKHFIMKYASDRLWLFHQSMILSEFLK